MSDANFMTDVANNMILDLENQLDWINEMCSSTSLRTGDMSTHDKVLHLELDKCIASADEMYKAMKFSLAVKWAHHEVAILKKKYREYHAKSELAMHKGCLMRLIRAQVIMMSPIITHWSEHVWRDILGEPKSVMVADWPEIRGGDESPLDIVDYIEDMLKDFKDKRNKAKKKKSKKKKGGAAESGQAASSGPPTKGIIFVQKQDPEWKCVVKTFLKEHFDENTSSFKASKKELISGVMKLSATNEGLKEQGKKLSGIVAWIIGAAEKNGSQALMPYVSFDEIAVLQEYQKYIAAELQFPEGVEIADASDHKDNPKAAEAQPGSPSLAESA